MTRIVLVCVLMTIVFSVVSTVDIKPVLIGQHLISYTEITADHLLHAALSQRYPDLGGRYVQAAYSMEIPSRTLIDFHGVEFDFMVGRRVSGSRSAYSFLWDALAILESELQLTLQFFETSAVTSQPLTSAQAPLYELTITPLLNKTSVYLFFNHNLANIYRASFILPTSNVTGKGLELPVGGFKASKTKFWLGLVGTLKSRDESSGYEYTFRLPVETATKGSMSIRDPDNILGLGYTNWTSASSVTSSLYAGIINPVMAYRMAGYVTFPVNPSPSSSSPTPTPVLSFSPSPSPSSPPSNVSLSVIPTPSPFENSTIVHYDSRYYLRLGLLSAFVILFIITMVAIIVGAWWKRSRDRKKHAYLNIDEELQERNDAANINLDSDSDEDGETGLMKQMGLLGSRLKTTDDNAKSLAANPVVGGGSGETDWLDGDNKS